MSTEQLNSLRLFVKLFVTSWVPILVAVAPNLFPSTISAVAIMAALTATVDGFFRIFGVGDQA